MLPTTFRVRETQLFRYTIASGDMRFIDVNERTVFLRHDPTAGPLLRGEIEGCAADCHVTLSQVLLEYALSCEGCQDQATAAELVACTGERLGRILALRLLHDTPELTGEARVVHAFQCLLQSVGASFQATATADGLRWTLARCPLHETAAQSGLQRGIPNARRGFVAICAGVLDALAPGWALRQPTRFGDAPLTEIVIDSALKETRTDG